VEYSEAKGGAKGTEVCVRKVGKALRSLGARNQEGRSTTEDMSKVPNAAIKIAA
jgi:hypothetical protein